MSTRYDIPDSHRAFFRELHELCVKYGVSIWKERVTFENHRPHVVYDWAGVFTHECGYGTKYRPSWDFEQYPPEEEKKER